MPKFKQRLFLEGEQVKCEYAQGRTKCFLSILRILNTQKVILDNRYVITLEEDIQLFFFDLERNYSLKLAEVLSLDGNVEFSKWNTLN